MYYGGFITKILRSKDVERRRKGRSNLIGRTKEDSRKERRS